MTDALIYTLFLFNAFIISFLIIRARWVYKRYRRYGRAAQRYLTNLAERIKSVEDLKNLPSDEELDYVFQKVLWKYEKMVWNIGVWNMEQMVYDLKTYQKIMMWDEENG